MAASGNNVGGATQRGTVQEPRNSKASCGRDRGRPSLRCSLPVKWRSNSNLLAVAWSEPMDGFPLELPLFLFATFAGALDWKRLAVRARRSSRRPRGSHYPDLGQSRACTDGHRRAAGSLQPLCAVSSGDRAGQVRRRGARCRGWISQRRARRHDRARGNSGHDLVRPARLAQGRAARGVSAGRCRDLSDERAVDRRKGRNHRGDVQAVPGRSASPAREHLARL